MAERPDNQETAVVRTDDTVVLREGAEPIIVRVENPAPPITDASSDADLVDRGLGLLRTVAIPASFTTAVLYYFGWLRAQTVASAWGFTTSQIGLSNEDYLLRAVPTLYRPFGLGLLTFVAVQRIASRTRHELEQRPWLRDTTMPLGTLSALTGGLLLCIAPFLFRDVTAIAHRSYWFVIGAVVIGGTALLTAGLWLRAAGRWTDRVTGEAADLPQRLLPAATTAGLIGVLMVGVFTLITQYAMRVGVQQADYARDTLLSEPFVTIFSEHDLRLQGEGINCADLPDSSTVYRHRCSGLKLVASGGGSLILVSNKYKNSRRTFIVPDDGNLRLDFDCTNLEPGCSTR